MTRPTEALKRIELTVVLPPKHNLDATKLRDLGEEWRKRWLAAKPTGTVLDHFYAGIVAQAHGHGESSPAAAEFAIFYGHTNVPLNNLAQMKHVEVELQTLAYLVQKLAPELHMPLSAVEIHESIRISPHIAAARAS